jgi:MFS family permease
MLGAVAFALTESPIRTGGSFDYCGGVLLSAALLAILLTLSKGSHWGWTSTTTLTLAGVGGVLLLAWVPFELLCVRNPLVDLRVAGRPAVVLVNIASVLTGFAMFANLLVTTQLLQLPTSSGYGLGLDVQETGLWLAPSVLIFGAMAPVSASVTRRFGPLTTLLAGSLLMSGSYAARVFFSQDLWQIVSSSMLVGVGTSMTFAAMPTLIMRTVPVTETASANGLNTLLRTIGTSVSSATMAAVTTTGLLRVGGDTFPAFGAFTTVFWLAAAMSLGAALLVLPMRRLSEYANEPREPAELYQGSPATSLSSR